MCIPKRSVESYRAIKEHPETDPDVASSYNVRPYEAVITWGGPRYMFTWRGRHGDELMNFEAVIDSNEGNIATVRMTNKNGLTFLLGQGRNTQAELLKFIRRYLQGFLPRQKKVRSFPDQLNTRILISRPKDSINILWNAGFSAQEVRL